MSVLPPTATPRAALADLRAFMRQRSREQVIGGMLAILSTVIIVILFIVDPQINTKPPEQVIYAESYAPTRTDADIKRDQAKDQEKRDQAKEARKKEFQKLEKAFGM